MLEADGREIVVVDTPGARCCTTADLLPHTVLSRSASTMLPGQSVFPRTHKTSQCHHPAPQAWGRAASRASRLGRRWSRRSARLLNAAAALPLHWCAIITFHAHTKRVQHLARSTTSAQHRRLLIRQLQVTSVAAPFTAADQAAVCSLVAHFGADVLKRSLLVFSHGDVLAADGATLADYLADAPPDLQVCCCS